MHRLTQIVLQVVLRSGAGLDGSRHLGHCQSELRVIHRRPSLIPGSYWDLPPRVRRHRCRGGGNGCVFLYHTGDPQLPLSHRVLLLSADQPHHGQHPQDLALLPTRNRETHWTVGHSGCRRQRPSPDDFGGRNFIVVHFVVRGLRRRLIVARLFLVVVDYRHRWDVWTRRGVDGDNSRDGCLHRRDLVFVFGDGDVRDVGVDGPKGRVQAPRVL